MRMRKPRRQEWRLSFASMSDIAFLLIIFFAVVGRFTNRNERPVSLPTAELGSRSPQREIEVVVNRDGEFFVNGSRVDPEGLNEEVAAYIGEGMDSESRTVSIHADRGTEYGAVAAAIEAVNQADAYLEFVVRHVE